jgi:ketosteroid isomerase-like protein
MAADQNRKLILEAYEAFRQGNPTPTFDALADDVVWTDRVLAANPMSGVYRGKQGVMEFFGKLTALAEFTRFDVLQVLAADETVVVLLDTNMTVKATGKSADLALVHVFTFRDGKVVAGDLYEDDSASPWV